MALEKWKGKGMPQAVEPRPDGKLGKGLCPTWHWGADLRMGGGALRLREVCHSSA